MKRFLLLLSVLLVTSACFEKHEYKLEYELTNIVQKNEASSYERQDGVLVYVYIGDEERWGTSSWENAVKGNAINGDGDALEQIAFGLPHESEPGVIVVPLAAEYVMIMAVDTVSQMVAKRNMTIELDVISGGEDIVWKAWNRSSHTSGEWIFSPVATYIPYQDEEE